MLLGWLFAAAALAEPAARPFPCCDNPPLERLLEHYLALHEALSSHPSPKEAEAAWAQLHRALQEGRFTGAEEHLIKGMLHKVRALDTTQPEEVRKAFREVSPGMVALALRHEGGSLTVVQAACEGDTPWLQRDSRQAHSPWRKACGALN